MSQEPIKVILHLNGGTVQECYILNGEASAEVILVDSDIAVVDPIEVRPFGDFDLDSVKAFDGGFPAYWRKP